MLRKEKNIAELFKAALTPNSTLYYPLQIERLVMEPGVGYRYRPDFFLDLRYGNRTYAFTVEIKRRSAPSVVRDSVAQLGNYAQTDRYPLLAVPYLSADLVGYLERAEVSGIDLNGNYLIRTPEFVALRLDQPNAYPESRQIKNIYTGNTSIVGRFLLSEPGPYRQVKEIAEGIERLGGGISPATISKGLNGLADDLIVRKNRTTIELLQPRRLLDRLRREYRPPGIVDTLRLNLPEDREETEKILNDVLGTNGWIYSGESSAEAYVATVPVPYPVLYTNAPDEKVAGLFSYRDDRFPTYELKRTDDAFAFFARNGKWASPVESCLALGQLDKREREISAEIERMILRELGYDESDAAG